MTFKLGNSFKRGSMALNLRRTVFISLTGLSKHAFSRSFGFMPVDGELPFSNFGRDRKKKLAAISSPYGPLPSSLERLQLRTSRKIEICNSSSASGTLLPYCFLSGSKTYQAREVGRTMSAMKDDPDRQLDANKIRLGFPTALWNLVSPVLAARKRVSSFVTRLLTRLDSGMTDSVHSPIFIPCWEWELDNYTALYVVCHQHFTVSVDGLILGCPYFVRVRECSVMQLQL